MDTANISQVLVKPPRFGALSIKLATTIKLSDFFVSGEQVGVNGLLCGMNFF